MKLATLRDGLPDGRLVLIRDDLTQMAAVPEFTTLQSALDDWGSAEPIFRAAAQAQNDGSAPHAREYIADHLAAPLPRAWQWLDGSAFPFHAALMQRK